MNKVTLSIPDDLVRRAKAKAALEGVSLSEVVRRYLSVWVQSVPSPTFTSEDAQLTDG